MFRRKVVVSLAVKAFCCFRGGTAQDVDCAGDGLLFGCEQPPAALPCAADVQRTWVVETAAQAQALAAAVNCSGGSFEVEWRGTVIVDEPIYVVDGTVLALTGAGLEAVMDGNSTTRLFTVVDAALHVSGVNMSSGAGSVGGAVAATGSILTLNGTNFAGNSASGEGGAVYVSGGSSVSFVGGEIFADNTATSYGGALFATENSRVSWTGDIHFLNNSCAGFGGALAVESSTVVATGNATFYSNVATGESGYGGAISAFSGSAMTFSGETTLFQDNFAGHSGGAIALSWSSEMTWSGSGHFVSNNASEHGGALIVGNSTLSWDGNAEFVGNTATRGGAIYSNPGSTLSWSGKSVLSNNFAAADGGAILLDASSASWTGDTEFSNNTAEDFGGAVSIESSSTLLSTGGTTLFSNNSALTSNRGFGGAVNVIDGSSAVWGAETTMFHGNDAGNGGGALAVSWSSEVSCTGPCQFAGNTAYTGGALTVSTSTVSWSADTTLVANGARFGGAIFVYNGSNLTWTGRTDFSSNEARSDGGAISCPMSGVSYSPLDSTLSISGTTSFVNNTSLANGGAVALLGGCALEIGDVDVAFSGNTADVAGGAVFLSGTGLGPTFSGVRFVSNSAQVGGAVSIVGSGNAKDAVDVDASNPTTFDGCLFVDNKAAATGGAIESAAGQDTYVRDFFEGNKAGTGGALRLAGTASMENCSFLENVSDAGEGAAVSNIGFISEMSDIFFSGNAFDCQPGTFLDFNPRSPFEAVCDGCDTPCDNCSFGEPLLEPTCSDVLEHSNSSGGNTTIETLSVEPGYWRATTVSPNVFECYNADACLGGLTGEAAFCREGYRGPYCAVCGDGYTAQLGFTCSECLGVASGMVLVSFVLVATLFAAAAVASYVISADDARARRGVVERVARYIPLQSMKILIVSWQILTQFTSVANVSFPGVYQRLLDGLDVFNFDLGWMFSASCVVEFDFHDRLLLSTIGPIVALLFLVGTYAVASRLHRGEAAALQLVWNKHVSMVLLLTFFVYASVSSTLFQAFACEDLDDGKNYLRADYRIECDSSKHIGVQVYAAFMVGLYAVGIPAFYGALLFRDRHVLKHEHANRVDSARVTSISDLWSPYRPSVFYYEVIECGRRILLAGVVVFIYPNTAAQIAITLMMAAVFAMLSEGLTPYASRWDAWLNRLGHAVVFVSMYVALLLKVDVAGERKSSQQVFEVFLVVVHACMILVVVVETAVVTWALKVEQLEEPAPRFRRGRSFSRGKREVAPTDGVDIFEDVEEVAPF